MATITRFLPKSSPLRKKIEADTQRIERSFNLKPGTLDRAVEQSQQTRRTSSSRTSPTTQVFQPMSVAPQTSFSLQAKVDEAKKNTELLKRNNELIRLQNQKRAEQLQRLKQQRIQNVVRTQATITKFLPEKLQDRTFDREAILGLRPGISRPITQEQYDAYIRQEERRQQNERERTKAIEKKINEVRQKLNEIESKDVLTFNDRKYIKTLNSRLEMLRRDLSKGISTGEVTRAEITPRQEEINKLFTDKLRGRTSRRGEIEMVALGFGTAIAENIKAIRYAPQTINYLIRNPSAILQIPSGLALAGKEFGEVLRLNPSYALGKIGGEIFFLYTSGKTIKVIGKASKNLNARLLRGQFTKLKNKYILTPSKSKNKLILKPKTPTRISKLNKLKQARKKDLRLIKREARGRMEMAKDFNKKIDDFSGRLVRSLERTAGKELEWFEFEKLKRLISERLREEVAKRGIQPITLDKISIPQKSITKVISNVARKKSFLKSISNKFKGLIKPRKLKVKDGVIQLKKVKPARVVKPKKISKSESIRLSKIKNANRQKRIESSLKGMGIELRNQKINDISRRFVKSLERTAGKELKWFEFERLKRIISDKIREQLAKGKIKEINLDKIKIPEKPFIKIIKSTQEITPNRVNKIIQLKTVTKPTSATQKFSQQVSSGRSILIKRSQPVQKSVQKIKILNQKVKVNKKELLNSLKRLEAIQSRITKLRKSLDFALKTGRNTVMISKYISIALKELSRLRGKTINLSTELNKNISILKNEVDSLKDQVPEVISLTLPKTGSSTRQDSILKQASKVIKESKKIIREKTKKPIKIPIIEMTKIKKNVLGKLNAFDVYAKPVKRKKGEKVTKLVRVNKSPLSKQRAEDMRNYIVDTSLSRTAVLRPAGLTDYKGQGIEINKIPRGYANKTNKKFRDYRIVKGKRVQLKNNRLIEKTPFIVDTSGEKRGISLRRRIQQLSGKRVTPNKLRKQRLENLKKARAKLKRLRAKRR